MTAAAHGVAPAAETSMTATAAVALSSESHCGHQQTRKQHESLSHKSPVL